MLGTILQKYLWYASSKEVKFTCKNVQSLSTKNALTLCIHICTDTLIGIEFLVSKTYLQGGNKNDYHPLCRLSEYRLQLYCSTVSNWGS